MKIVTVDRCNCMSSDCFSFAERRLLFALSRFDTKIDTVVLTLEDSNGPRGGIDKCCQLVVKLRLGTDVIISDQDHDLKACISRVADRAGRCVSRRLERSLQSRRRRVSLGFDGLI